MDTILEAMINSDFPDTVKKSLIDRTFLTHYDPQDCRSIIKLTTHLITTSDEPFVQNICLQVYAMWATKNKECLQEFLTVSSLNSLFDRSAYYMHHRSPIHKLIYRSLDILKDTERGLELFQFISRHAVLLASRTHSLKELQEIALILLSWPVCIPQDVDSRIQLATIIVKGTACVEVELVNSRQILFDINLISQLFKHLLSNLDKQNIMTVLREVYSLISNPNIEPSWALSSIVQYLPMTVSPEVVSIVLTDMNIGNDVLYLSLKQMMNWLLLSSDPNNIADWIMTFLRGLALASKFDVLCRLTVDSIEQVFGYLDISESKTAAFLVLSHMFLSYKHSPDVFHKIVRYIPQRIVTWQSKSLTDEDNKFLNQFVTLVNTMLYKQNGYPDLYDPILAVLDVPTFPKANPDLMNSMLNKHKWASSHSAYISLPDNCTPRSDTGKTGLMNGGNTCYMNSIIQTLYMTDEFHNAVVSTTPTKYEIVLKSMKTLFAFLSHTQRTALNVVEFYSVSRAPWFEKGNQQDCSEYLRYLLDILHEQEMFSVSSSSLATSSSSQLSLAHKSRVHRTFAGKLVTSYKCVSCRKISESAENFIDLHLAFPSIPENISTLCLEDLIDYYLRPELLEKENRYFCSSCNALSDAERSKRIVETPQYLILTLLRFSFDSGTHSRSKILTDVAYPLKLHLPVCRSQERDDSVPPNKRRNGEVFDLHAVVIHSGISSERGHYYTCARHPTKIGSSSDFDGRSGDQEWYMFNDSRVSYCSFKSFGTVTERFPKDTAYVLFYRKGGTEENANPKSLVVNKEIKDMIEKDNVVFLQDKEIDAQKSRVSCSRQAKHVEK